MDMRIIGTVSSASTPEPNLNGPLANLMVEAIDALAGKIDQLALRVEAKEEVLARMAGFSEAVEPSGPASRSPKR